MKIVTWNVNGLRACLEKGFLEYVVRSDADIVCIQETKMQRGQAEIDLPGFEEYWNSAEKKGYSGTACFSRIKPITATYGLGIDRHAFEGRVITLEFERFYLVNVYTPNSQEKLARLDYRMAWDDDFRSYVKKLDGIKPVIICGDLNVAHQEIDLKNPKTNRMNAGFTDQEREKMTQLLDAGFIDSFRFKYPYVENIYTWWSYRFNARANNAGWRIDYFLVSSRIADKVEDQIVKNDILGSDHCPVELIAAL